MIDSPILNELIAEKQAEALHKAIIDVLEDYLGEVPPDVKESVRAIQDLERLNALTRIAARCTELGDFRRQLVP